MFCARFFLRVNEPPFVARFPLSGAHRGAAVALSGKVVSLGLLYFGIGRILAQRIGLLTRLQALSMSSPFSLLVGYLGLRHFAPDGLSFEYRQSAF